jgi:ATP-binding cassette subfamily F protein 3
MAFSMVCKGFGVALVTFRNISKEYAGRYVLDNVSFEIGANQKIGLIGANGSGKTTLLRLINELEKPTEGGFDIAGDVRIGYVPQYVTFHQDQTVIESLLAEHRQLTDNLRQNEHVVAQSDPSDLHQALHEYQLVRDAYDRCGGDHFEQRAYAMLDALGLGERAEHKVSYLSGGEQNVLAMTQALLAEPNLLILDEPGNHLDYMGLAWLEEFLNRFRGAILIVSHNRYLLDRVVNHVYELEKGKITVYPGNYSAYREIRQQRLKTQQAQYKAYQQRIAHLETIVQKFADIAQGHASDNTWGKRLRARRSQLQREKEKAVEKPASEQSQVKITLQSHTTRADIALQVNHYSKAFDDLKLLENVSWQIGGGQRWALLGPNGCGKTSFIKDIVAQGKWEHEEIRVGPSFSIGYCSQQQEILNSDNTVFDELNSIVNVNQQQIFDILARFLFTDEEVNKKISNLSGGERNRLQLARFMLLKPNFLILDEPTNHLDIPTREAVEEALKDFKGTILVVSHDRYFLDNVVDHIAEIKDNSLYFYSGNFTNYWQTQQKNLDQTSGRITSRAKDRQTDEQPKAKAGGRAWLERKVQTASLRKAQKELEQIEQQIQKAEQAKETLEEQVAQAFTDGENEKGNELSRQLQQVISDLEGLYENWMEAEQKLSSLSE